MKFNHLNVNGIEHDIPLLISNSVTDNLKIYLSDIKLTRDEENAHDINEAPEPAPDQPADYNISTDANFASDEIPF